MDGSANFKKTRRTLAAQPAAAAHVGVQESAVRAVPAGRTRWPDEDEAMLSGRAPRTRLERLLLAARQMQQR